MRYVLAAFLMAGCVSKADEGVYRDPTSLGDETTAGGITAQLLAPQVAAVLSEPIATVVFSAYTADGSTLIVTGQDVDGSIYTGTAIGEPGVDQRFEMNVPLLHGKNPLRVRIAERDGVRNRLLEVSLVYDGPAPGVRYSVTPRAEDKCGAPLTANVTAARRLCVLGRLSLGAAAVSAVRVGAGEPGQVADVRAGTFEAVIDMDADSANEIVVSVSDTEGRQTRVVRRIVQDNTPPTLAVPLAGDEPLRVERNRAEIDGTVTDDRGVGRVLIVSEVGNEVEAPLDADGRFVLVVQLEPGANRFDVVARDVAGNESRLRVSIVRERLIRLGRATSGGTTQLRLDRRALEEILSPDAQRAIEVITLSLRTPVVEALRAIREPERFGLDTSEWGPAEFNMANLLRMTPDTADLSGSSLEELLSIAPAVGLPSPRLLAQLLDIEPTETFLSLESLTEALLDRLIGTHPEVVRGDDGDPALRLTMFDVLQNLEPVAARFGPSGQHPGFLSGESRSMVLEPGFLLTVPVQSNIEVREGVDGSRGGKDFLFLVDRDSSTISFDFLSEETSIVGLVDEPTVDLQFAVGESDQFTVAGSAREARPDPEQTGFFRGSGEAFDALAWQFERIVAEAAYGQYALRFAPSYENLLQYDAGSIVNAAVLEWARGWVTITTSGGLGSPPEPTYAWDVLTEVAQLRLHEGGIPEGQADLAFRVAALPIGLNADDLIDTLRPTLQAQEAELASRIIDGDTVVASGVDFFWEPAGSTGFLFFVAPSDLGGGYPYERPGFFTDASLTTRSSTTGALGTNDTVHHKLVPVAGQSHFFEDDEAAVYRLDIVDVEPSGVTVRVIPVGGGS